MNKKSASHTEGPWIVPGDGYEHALNHRTLNIWHEKGNGESVHVAEVFCQDGTWTDSEAKANSRLIAAAPDMLEALKFLVSEQPGTEQYEKWHDAHIRGALSAIAKAEGANNAKGE
jgi:hypothetical protein